MQLLSWEPLYEGWRGGAPVGFQLLYILWSYELWKLQEIIWFAQEEGSEGNYLESDKLQDEGEWNNRKWQASPPRRHPMLDRSQISYDGIKFWRNANDIITHKA